MNFHYDPDNFARGQWWHWVAALSAIPSGREYGVQFSYFKFGDMGMTHMALVDVAESHYYQKAIPFLIPLPQPIGKNRCVTFDFGKKLVQLIFAPTQSPVMYPSKDIHWGYPSLGVAGMINDEYVAGHGCFDREIFKGKKLTEHETGWNWSVAWLEDGRTVIDYQYDGKPPRFPMHYGPRVSWSKFERLGPQQEWKKGHQLAFSYIEELCEVAGTDEDGKHVFGRGYRETVGYDGLPDI